MQEGYPSVKQVAVRSGALKAHNRAVGAFHKRIDQQPIRLDVSIAIALPILFEGMVFVMR